MKRLIFLIIALLTFISVAFAQYKVAPNLPYSSIKSNPGFITINEFTGGYGLAGTASPYSKYFYGFTTINGYQVNRNFMFAGGTGISVYNSGILIPLFIDLRYTFYTTRITPFLYADGGLLLKPEDMNYTEVFINPGVGARYSLSRNWALLGGIGFLTQMDGASRASFINLKTGLVYKF